MKRLKTYLMAAAMAVGLIAFLGCGGVKDDPDAVTNAEKEDVSNDPDDPEEISGKGEPNIKPKKGKGDDDDDDPDPSGEDE